MATMVHWAQTYLLGLTVILAVLLALQGICGD